MKNPVIVQRKAFKEGDIFAVPLVGGGYGLGLVVRKWGRAYGFLPYFFGPHIFSTLEEIDPTVVKAENVVYIYTCNTHALLDGRWPVIGRVANYSHEEWPMPPLLFGEAPSENRNGKRIRKWCLYALDDKKMYTTVGDPIIVDKWPELFMPNGATNTESVEGCLRSKIEAGPQKWRSPPREFD